MFSLPVLALGLLQFDHCLFCCYVVSSISRPFRRSWLQADRLGGGGGWEWPEISATEHLSQPSTAKRKFTLVERSYSGGVFTVDYFSKVKFETIFSGNVWLAAKRAALMWLALCLVSASDTGLSLVCPPSFNVDTEASMVEGMLTLLVTLLSNRLHLGNIVVFKWLSKVITRSQLLRLVIGLKISRLVKVTTLDWKVQSSFVIFTAFGSIYIFLFCHSFCEHLQIPNIPGTYSDGRSLKQSCYKGESGSNPAASLINLHFLQVPVQLWEHSGE